MIPRESEMDPLHSIESINYPFALNAKYYVSPISQIRSTRRSTVIGVRR